MRNYLLISGGWLAAAAVIAFAYARLGSFAAGSDAHHLEPEPLRRRRRRRCATFARPGWILAPPAVASAAAFLMVDFALSPEDVPSVPATAPVQTVRMAEAQAPPRRAGRGPQPALRRSADAAPAGAVLAPSPGLIAAPRSRSTAPAASRPARRRRPAAAARPSPAAPVAAAARSASPSPVPDPPGPRPARTGPVAGAGS